MVGFSYYKQKIEVVDWIVLEPSLHRSRSNGDLGWNEGNWRMAVSLWDGKSWMWKDQ